MAHIITAIAQDPTAIVESIAAAASACYVLKLAFLSPLRAHNFSEGLSSSGRISQLTNLNSYKAGELFPLKEVPQAANMLKRTKLELRERLLRLFAVGELIPTPKKSLRRQRRLRWAY